MGEMIANILLILGGFMALSGALGVLRLPDFYSRLHPAGTADTLAQLLLIAGLVLHLWIDPNGSYLAMGKLLAISMLLFVTTPTATHAISRAAYISGLRPWTGDSTTDDDSQLPESESPLPDEGGS